MPKLVGYPESRSARRAFYEIDTSNEFGSGVRHGQGVNLLNLRNIFFTPLELVRVAGPGNAIIDKSTSKAATDDLSQDLITKSGAFRSEYKAEEEAEIIRANFSVSYNLNSLEAAFEQVKNKSASKKVIYYIYSTSGIVVPMPGRGVKLEADDLLQIEGIESAVDRMSRFVAAYGTHFVSSVEYGSRLAIRAEISGTNEDEKQTISAALSATFGAVSGDAKYFQERRRALKSENVTVIAELISGDKALTMTSLDDVLDFLANLKSEKVKIVPGPIHIEMSSYFSLLSGTATPNLFEDFKPVSAPPPLMALHGVPVGTILPWYPPADCLVAADDGTMMIEPPSGWAVCDGRDGTPKLADRYLVGTTDAKAIASEIGSNSHNHRVAGKTGYGLGHEPYQGGTQFEREGNETFSQRYQFDVLSEDASTQPASTRFVFIIKLSDS